MIELLLHHCLLVRRHIHRSFVNWLILQVQAALDRCYNIFILIGGRLICLRCLDAVLLVVDSLDEEGPRVLELTERLLSPLFWPL